MSKSFQLSIGPVQGFVAQARRTRDFWAGSFLLSWLSGVAMCQVEAQGGNVRFPKCDKRFLQALREKPKFNGKTPEYLQQASIPNRFLANVPEDFQPQSVVMAINNAWLALSTLVWKQYINPVLADFNPTQQQDTALIWNRQIHDFWEIHWCLGDENDSTQLLNQRKYIRNHLPEDEPGIKCMMIDGLQELSGIASPNAQALSDFWQPITEHIGSIDLRDGEHLCALALIKRCFVKPFSKLNVSMGEWTLHGWNLSASAPSVGLLGAIHWIELAIKKSQQNAAVESAWDQFFIDGKALCKHLPESNVTFHCLEYLFPLQAKAKNWIGLDSNLYYLTLLNTEWTSADSTNLNNSIKSFSRLKSSAELPDPSPFFSILLMDGDQLGTQIADKNKQTAISDALEEFTQRVPEKVRLHNGFLVYAGGDDVLVLLPVMDALPCALALRQCYQDCMHKQNQTLSIPVSTSLSGAIIYAHIRQPLTTSLNRAHKLLDTVAKDSIGRDAIAVEVWKPGGLHLRWGQPWEKAIDKGNLDLSVWVKKWSEKKQRLISSSFLTRLITVFDKLELEQFKNLGENCIFRQLALSEYRKSSGGLSQQERLNSKDEVALLDALMELCTPWKRKVTNRRVYFEGNRCTSLQTDGLKLLRFLVQNNLAEEVNDAD